MRLPEIKEPNLVKLTQIVNSGSGTVGLEFQCLSEDPLWLGVEGGHPCCSLARLVYPTALLFLAIYHCLSDALFFTCVSFSPVNINFLRAGVFLFLLTDLPQAPKTVPGTSCFLSVGEGTDEQRVL